MTLVPAAGRPAHPTPLPSEPSARTYTLADLVRNVRDGRVRVPHFQRGLRWSTPDAVALIDSVLRGYPIGSLLLWKRPGPAETVRLGNVHIQAPDLSEALYVVDGQQRVTTFVNAFDDDAGRTGPFALVYDLKERPYQVRARRPNDQDAIPLPVLFDLAQLLRWTSEHPQYVDSIDEINKATTRLREFHVPAYEVRSEDDRALRHIYDRMNNAGKRLTRAEAFWGLFAPAEHTAENLMSFATLQEHVEVQLNWGRIDDDTILRLFLARRGPDVARDIHLEFDDERRPSIDFPGEREEAAHRHALDALDRAVRFLRDEAGIPHFTFLAFRYLLVVLVRYFALFPDPHPRNRELLRRWYWRAALAGPSVVRGSATGAMRMLAGCVRHGDEAGSTQALIDALVDAPTFRPDPAVFRSNHSATHIMLCALWSLRPVSPDDGLPFSTSDLALQIGTASSPNSACPEIYRRGDLPVELRQAAGNRAIMPGIPLEQVRSFLHGDTLFVGATGAAADSHVMGPGITHLAGSAQDVVRRRTTAISILVADFLRGMTGEGFDDGPPLDDLDLDEPDEGDASADW